MYNWKTYAVSSAVCILLKVCLIIEPVKTKNFTKAAILASRDILPL